MLPAQVRPGDHTAMRRSVDARGLASGPSDIGRRATAGCPGPRYGRQYCSRLLRLAFLAPFWGPGLRTEPNAARNTWGGIQLSNRDPSRSCSGLRAVRSVSFVSGVILAHITIERWRCLYRVGAIRRWFQSCVAGH